MEKKGKGQQDVTVGAIYRGAHEHIAFRAGGNEKAQVGVGRQRHSQHVREVHDCAQQPRGLTIHSFEMG